MAMNMETLDVASLLEQARARLIEAYGARLQAVVLYGSMLRGDSMPDSDIDLLVVMRDQVVPRDDLRAAIHALYPLTLRYGHPFSPLVVDAASYQSGAYPLYQSVQKEGLVA